MTVRRFAGCLLITALVAGAWYLYKNYDLAGMEKVSLNRRGGLTTTRTRSPWAGSGMRTAPTIRLAAWSSPALDPSRSDFDECLPTILNLIRRFDLIGLHGLRNVNESFLKLLCEKLSERDRAFEYFLGPPTGPDGDERRACFLYDGDAVELDRQRSLTVHDPGDFLVSDPLLGWFRARGVAPEEAFTFCVVLIELDPLETDRETIALTPIYRSVWKEFAEEDDIILMGDLGSPTTAAKSLAAIRGLRQVTPAAAEVAIRDVREQMFLPLPATAEFTGRAGLLDLVREFNLTTDEAQRLALKAPIWGEFRVLETIASWP